MSSRAAWSVAGDLRALTNEQFEKAKAAMRAIVAASLPKTQAENRVRRWVSAARADGRERAIASSAYNRASQDLGLGPVEAVSPDKAGAADVSFVAAHVPMIIDAGVSRATTIIRRRRRRICAHCRHRPSARRSCLRDLRGEDPSRTSNFNFNFGLLTRAHGGDHL
jgi:metal-dependent amidase/aminoacylase/carboxypeptidase family protein